MARKLVLKPAPTFRAVVAIHQPEGEPAEVEMVFKHRNKDELKELVDQLSGKDDVALVKEMATGWDLADDFNDANIKRLVTDHHAAAVSIFNTYIEKLKGLRLGN